MQEKREEYKQNGHKNVTEMQIMQKVARRDSGEKLTAITLRAKHHFIASRPAQRANNLKII